MKKRSVFLNRSAIALVNALRSPDILQALAKHGLSEEQIKQTQTYLFAVQQLDRQYHDATVEAKAATQSLYTVRDRVQKMYGQHVVLSRIALAHQPALLEKMDLDGVRKKGLAEWINQVNTFYRHAATVKGALAKFNITGKELAETQKLLDRVAEMQTLQVQLKGRMQVISEQRKQAYNTLRKAISKFFRIARIALEAEPQQLETLGLVIKATV